MHCNHCVCVSCIQNQVVANVADRAELVKRLEKAEAQVPCLPHNVASLNNALNHISDYNYLHLKYPHNSESYALMVVRILLRLQQSADNCYDPLRISWFAQDSVYVYVLTTASVF